MGFFTAFATGALQRREDVQNQAVDDMQKREEFMRETYARGAPALAMQKQKAATWNEDYNNVLRMGGTEAQARVYAHNPSQESLESISRNVNAVRYGKNNLGAESTKAVNVDNAIGAPPPAESVDHIPEAGQEEEAGGAAYGQVPTAPAVEEITVHSTAPGQPTGGVTAPTDMNAKRSFLDVLLGRIPTEVQNANIFRKMGRDIGVAPEAIQSDYNKIMSGDYAFTPPRAENDGKGIPFAYDVATLSAAATQAANTVSFRASEDRSRFIELYMQGQTDPEALKAAWKIPMSDVDTLEAQAASSASGQLTDTAALRNIREISGDIMGGKWNTDANGKQTLDFGAMGEDSAIFSQIHGQVIGDTIAQLEIDNPGVPLRKINPKLFDKTAALYFTLNAGLEVNRNPTGTKALRLKANQIKLRYQITKQDLDLAFVNQQKRLAR